MLYGTQYIGIYSCIMANTSNYAKDNMASAAVLLDFTPFILVSLGSNMTELVLIVSRHLILAILLGLKLIIYKYQYEHSTIPILLKISTKEKADLYSRRSMTHGCIRLTTFI
jgi:hypothetical protein